MKHEKYISRLFKGYEIRRYEIIEGHVHVFYLAPRKLRHKDYTCRYIVYESVEDPDNPRIRREIAQAKELVKALLTLPRYE